MKTDTKTAKSSKVKGKISTKSAAQLQKYKKTATAGRSVPQKNNKKSRRGRPPRLQSQNEKVAAVPLRRSTRKIKFVSIQNKKSVGRKKGKGKGKRKPKKKTYNKRKTEGKKVLEDTCWQRKRSEAWYSYWLNGLLLSRKPGDERVIQFRRDKFFSSSASLASDVDLPKCCLCCESGYTSTSDYITCELCGGNNTILCSGPIVDSLHTWLYSAESFTFSFASYMVICFL